MGTSVEGTQCIGYQIVESHVRAVLYVLEAVPELQNLSWIDSERANLVRVCPSISHPESPGYVRSGSGRAPVDVIEGRP
jgi:hypothetical protein